MDGVLELFPPERRRFVLYYLEDQEGPVSVGELAANVEERETGERPAELPAERPREVLLTLEHQRLPNGAQTVCIEYDSDRNIVERTNRLMY